MNNKKRLLSIVQFAIGIGLLVVLFATMKNKTDLLDAVRDVAHRWRLLLAGTLAFGGCLAVCALRWRILLAGQDLKLAWFRSWVLYMIGHFFNSFLFGVTGGDLVKAFYAAKLTHHKKAEVISTIILDRLVGLFALVILIVAIMACRLRFFLAHPETRVALIFFTGLFFGGIVLCFIMFRQDIFDRWPWLRRLKENSAVGSLISRMYGVFQIALTEPSVMWRTLGLSILNHIMLVTSVALLGLALAVRLPFVDYLTTIPIVNAVAAIPVTPGGLGTRETAARFLLGVLDVPATRAVLLSLLMYASQLAWSVVGGAVYLVYSLRLGSAKAAQEG